MDYKWKDSTVPMSNSSTLITALSWEFVLGNAEVLRVKKHYVYMQTSLKWFEGKKYWR